MTRAALDRLGRGAGLAALSIPLATLSLPALLGAIGAALVLLVPSLGLVGAAFGVPFGALAGVSSAAGALTVTPLVLLWTAVPWILLALCRRRLPDIQVPLLLPLLTFLGALGLASWTAPDLVRAVFETARWFELALALLLVVGLVRRAATLQLVLISVLLAGATAALVGIGMAIQQAGPEAFAILGGRVYRAHGTFGQPNPFGGYMNMVWPLGAGLLLAGLTPGASRRNDGSVPDESGTTGTRLSPARAAARQTDGNVPDDSDGSAPSPWWPALVLIGGAVAAVAGVAVVLSWSRGAWLAAAVGAGAMGVVWLVANLRPPITPRRAGVVGLAMVVLTVFVLAAASGRTPAAVTGRLASVADTFTVWDVADAEVDDRNFATIERVAHWEAAVRMWSDAPWLGQGPGQYELLYAAYRLPRWEEPLGHAHNFYLHLLAESGIVGLTAYLVFFGACTVRALRAGLRPAGRVHRALGLGMVGVLAALAFHSLVDNLYVHETTVHLGLALGLMVTAERIDRGTRA